jgi:hypothetical protein
MGCAKQGIGPIKAETTAGQIQKKSMKGGGRKIIGFFRKMLIVR